MGATSSIAHGELHALCGRSNYAGAGGSEAGTLKIIRAAKRLKEDRNLLYLPFPGTNTTILYEAARLGGHETLCVIKLLAESADNEEEFLNVLNWVDQNGRSALHVATTGEAAAALLLSGCTMLNFQDNQGNTPLLLATKNQSRSTVPVLLSWGGCNEKVKDFETGQTAIEHANYLLYPRRDGSQELLNILRRQVDMISYPGVQWLTSKSIADDLKKSGVKVHRRPGSVDDATLLETCVYIRDLPAELQSTAAKFDLDHSGTIGFEDLEKIDQKRELVHLHKGKLVISPIKVTGPTGVLHKERLTMADTIKITDLPVHIQNGAKAWDVTNSGSISLTNLAKLDSTFMTQLLSPPMGKEMEALQSRNCPDPFYPHVTELKYYDAPLGDGGFPDLNLDKSGRKSFKQKQESVSMAESLRGQ